MRPGTIAPVLERLRKQGDDAPLARLADLIVEQTLATPLADLLPPEESAEATVRWLREFFASEEAAERMLELEGRVMEALRERGGALGALVGDELSALLLSLAERPKMPGREVALQLLDREPTRLLIRKLFFEALVNFGKRVRSTVVENPLTKRLGGLGRLAERAKANPFGAIAGGMMDAVSDEIDRRAAEYADAALAGLVHKLADLLSDPAMIQQQVALRVEMTEGLLELDADQIAREWERGDPAERIQRVHRGLLEWAESDEAVRQVETLLSTLLGDDAERSFGEILDELGLSETYRELAAPSLRRQLEGVVESEAFAAWLLELFDGLSVTEKEPEPAT